MVRPDGHSAAVEHLAELGRGWAPQLCGRPLREPSGALAAVVAESARARRALARTVTMQQVSKFGCAIWLYFSVLGLSMLLHVSSVCFSCF